MSKTVVVIRHPSPWGQASQLPDLVHMYHYMKSLNIPRDKHPHPAAEETEARSQKQFAGGCSAALSFFLLSQSHQRPVGERKTSW